MEKDAILHLRISAKLKERLEAVAKEQDLSFTDYVREALENWSTFDTHFLEKIFIHAQGQKMPMPIVIQQLLTSYMAQDYAFMEVFGKPTRAFARAFQHDVKDKKLVLIEGNDLSEVVLQQTKEDIAGLRDKMIEASESGKPLHISKQEATILAAAKAAKELSVKPEAKYTPMARAKAAKP